MAGLFPQHKNQFKVHSWTLIVQTMLSITSFINNVIREIGLIYLPVNPDLAMLSEHTYKMQKG